MVTLLFEFLEDRRETAMTFYLHLLQRVAGNLGVDASLSASDHSANATAARQTDDAGQIHVAPQLRNRQDQLSFPQQPSRWFVSLMDK